MSLSSVELLRTSTSRFMSRFWGVGDQSKSRCRVLGARFPFALLALPDRRKRCVHAMSRTEPRGVAIPPPTGVVSGLRCIAGILLEDHIAVRPGHTSCRHAESSTPPLRPWLAPAPSQDPGEMWWLAPCEGSNMLHFNDGALAARTFPGLLTVSILAAEGLPVVALQVVTAGGSRGGRLERACSGSPGHGFCSGSGGVLDPTHPTECCFGGRCVVGGAGGGEAAVLASTVKSSGKKEDWQNLSASGASETGRADP